VNTSGLALCIYLTFIIYFNASVFDTISDLRQIVTVGFFAALVGFVDDRINLSPTVKTFFLFFPCMYLILNGIKLHDIGNYEIIGT
jgi:UDP-N-acetylmuramyl pentapeptide phosphotransferase/UDP-N-acetylglucosamine-1-phosphate transferase